MTTSPRGPLVSSEVPPKILLIRELRFPLPNPLQKHMERFLWKVLALIVFAAEVKPLKQTKPKRPLSGFNLFFKEERRKILHMLKDPSKVSPDYTVDDGFRRLQQNSRGTKEFDKALGKMIEQRWRNMDQRKCMELASRDAEQYRQDMHYWSGGRGFGRGGRGGRGRSYNFPNQHVNEPPPAQFHLEQAALSYGIALWDVLHNSEADPNDPMFGIPNSPYAFLMQNESIKAICLIGQEAEGIFRQHFDDGSGSLKVGNRVVDLIVLRGLGHRDDNRPEETAIQWNKVFKKYGCRIDTTRPPKKLALLENYPCPALVSRNIPPKVLLLGREATVLPCTPQRHLAYSKQPNWRILSLIVSTITQQGYLHLKQSTFAYGIAIWDVLSTVPGTTKEEEKPNQIEGFLRRHPSIQALCFDGQYTYETFLQHFNGAATEEKYTFMDGRTLDLVALPCSNRSCPMPFLQKVSEWQREFEKHGCESLPEPAALEEMEAGPSYTK